MLLAREIAPPGKITVNNTVLILLTCLSSAMPLSATKPALVIVLVIDGLRPDSITDEATPNLERLKKAGVWYTQSHSVFPTVTRVNTASISTGTLPAQHGIASNALYLPAVSGKPLSNGDYRNLLTLGKLNGGRVVAPKSLEEYLSAAGVRYVAISSGSTGNALLLNPTAPYGQGSLINPGFESRSRVAFPDQLNAVLLSRFGQVKAEEGDEAMIWTERVLREYVLDVLHPQVVIDWMGRTDSAQHKSGAGSPEALAALRLVDQQIGLLLIRLRELNLEDKTDIIVACDHGFDYEPAADLILPWRDPKLAPGDVVADMEGGTTLLYVKDHDPEKISVLVEKLQASAATNAIFVASARPEAGNLRCSPGAVKGFVPGTFALELVSQCLVAYGPDMIVTYQWNSEPNPFGVPGTQLVPGSSKNQPTHNGHGGLNPFVTHSTLLAAGPDFLQGKTIDSPAGNQDITPTLLALQGLAMPASLDGRVLSEALKNAPKGRRFQASHRTFKVTSGTYCAELAVSYAGDHAYFDHASRCTARP